MTHGGEMIFSHNFSSLALMVWHRQCLEDYEQKDQRMNESNTRLFINLTKIFYCLPFFPAYSAGSQSVKNQLDDE